MKDRNKTIFIAFLIVSAIIMLAQTVTIVTHLDSQRKFGPIIAGIEIAVVALLSYGTLHPEINHNYLLKKIDGRWKWEKETYAPDPDGMRYITAGVGSLLVALFFVIFSGLLLKPDIVTKDRISIAALVLLIPFAAVNFIIENSLRKKSKN